jgi:hypothetical protein
LKGFPLKQNGILIDFKGIPDKFYGLPLQIQLVSLPNSMDFLSKIDEFLFNFKGIPTKLYGLPSQIP